MKNKITALESSFHTSLEQVKNQEALEALRIKFLGRNGLVTELLKTISSLSLEEKRVFAPQMQQLKTSLEQACVIKQQDIFAESLTAMHESNRLFDVTASKTPHLQGSLHVYTKVIQELEDIFMSMGYAIADGQEIETSHYNFETLNIPKDHPARDSHDTFWLNIPGMLMRTHTSTVQAHTMEQGKPPFAVLAPGRCYRNEATDASHDFMFTQAECLFVDKDVSLAHLLATAQAFISRLFDTTTTKIRVRPGYFPFVEPGLEIDISCPFCAHGCSVCKKTGWIELLGAGLIHPNVLTSCKIDPTIYSGFAFGMGIERLAMIKYGIEDIRLFHSSNLSFLKQF